MKQRHPVRRILLCMAVLLLGDLLYHGVCIWRYAGVDETRAADAAIVLGAAAYESGPSPVYTERLNHGIWLYQQGYVQKLILTGGTAAGNRCFIPCRRTCGRSYSSRHEQHQTSCGRSRFGCCSGISNGLLSALIAIEPRALRGICFTTPHKNRHVMSVLIRPLTCLFSVVGLGVFALPGNRTERAPAASPFFVPLPLLFLRELLKRNELLQLASLLVLIEWYHITKTSTMQEIVRD